jgi:hypothetical protein
VPGTESSPVRFASASYRSVGIYDGGLLSDSVTIRVHGRTTEPTAPCVSPTDGVDIVLSDEFTLQSGDPTNVVVGGSDHGPELARIISQPDYWIGAQLSGGPDLVGDDKILLKDGWISVTIW